MNYEMQINPSCNVLLFTDTVKIVHYGVSKGSRLRLPVERTVFPAPVLASQHQLWRTV